MATQAINLLPGKAQGSIDRETLSPLVLFVLVSLVGLIFAATGIFWALDKDNHRRLARQREQQLAITKFIEETKAIQLYPAYIADRGAALAKLQTDSLNYLNLLQDIERVTPDQLRVDSFSLDAKKQIGLVGGAKDRALITNFTESLTGLPSLSDVVLNQVNATASGFSFTVTMKLPSAAAAKSPKPVSSP